LALEVHAAAPDINLSTIYRNLDELEQLGIVIHSHLGHGPATYNLAALAHGHLVCDNCGAVIEAPGELFQGLGTAAQTRYGFEIDPHHFAVPGLCQTCRLRTHDTGGSSRKGVSAARRARGLHPTVSGTRSRRG
jgi:Fe2+ or Zn2+ uptake regulation protein